jgi:hypothetical protein
MIRYDLKCARGCEFDAWFKDYAAFDALKAAAQVVCPSCGSTDVEKALMAPRVSTSRKSAKARSEAPAEAKTAVGALSAPTDPELAKKLRDLQDYLTRNSDDVGSDFPEEARRIHYGEADKRQIHGFASAEQAHELTEEGVPIAPLPVPPRRTN